MKKNIYHFIALILLFQSCSSPNYLKNSSSTFLDMQGDQMMKYSYEEEYKVLGHNYEPWETTNYNGKGDFWIGEKVFLRQDTLTNARGKKYTSLTDYNDGVLLYLDYGDATLLSITRDQYFEKIINTSRYTPSLVMEYFFNNEAQANINIVDEYAICSIQMGIYNVDLYINISSNMVDRITYLSYDELYGDVTTSYHYSSYDSIDGLTYPKLIQIDKINGKVTEIVKITARERVSSDLTLLEKPVDYNFAEAATEDAPEIKVTKYNEYIYFLDLKHTDDKIMIVEMEDYLLVAEAPMNAENGELIIAEAKKIAPSKPIKYFVFGHHHPHYLGGLRAFVHEEATILCTDISKDYVSYIVNASHALKPDNLHLNPKNLKTQIVSDSLVLSGENEMKIYFMGEKSAHTKDFLIYYFPNDKLLFQDDLCWIPKKGPITKARSRQVGLYHFIKELNIEVDTIIQSWPVTSHKVKTIFPFTDLEQSMLIE